MKNNTIIFGDSYSTFENFVPEDYKVYYSESGRPETDVKKVEETWWYQVLEKANLKLVLNDSLSGSTIGYTGYNNTDCSKSSSFIYRLNNLIDSDFFNQNRIDTVFVFGGTNDSWSDAPLGNIKFDDFKNEDLYSVLPAICYFLKTLKSALPSAKIYCLVNTEIKTEIADCFERACNKYDITRITFDKIDKRSGHPTVKGMQDIKDGVLKVVCHKPS